MRHGTKIQAEQQGRRVCLAPRLRPLIVCVGIRSEGGGRPSPFRGERSRQDDDYGGTGSCGLQLWSGSFLCCRLSPLRYLHISSYWNLTICLFVSRSLHASSRNLEQKLQVQICSCSFCFFYLNGLFYLIYTFLD